MAAGFLDGSALITDTVSLEDVATAFENVRHGRGLKTQVTRARAE
jgi:Zn-dependent alcohol dehydrogenase